MATDVLLRERLHQAVDALEPSPMALQRVTRRRVT